MLSNSKPAMLSRENALALANVVTAVRASRPLVHCITNYVTVNDCANALLAVGGSPVMADDRAEAAEITGIANALVVNIGTLNERTIASMEIAGIAAAGRGIPTVLDPVGAGASRLRTDTALSLIGKIPFSVIRGNASEIKTLFSGTGSTRGVDASEEDSRKDGLDSLRVPAMSLALKTRSIVAITGATDIVTDGRKTYVIRNGHPLMGSITGSGCMLSAILGAFTAAAQDTHVPLLDGVAAALCAMGISGEKAARENRGKGTASYRVALIDALSRIDAKTVLKGMKVDVL